MPPQAKTQAEADQIAAVKSNYLKGFIPILPWIMKLRSRPFFFGGNFTVGANNNAQLNVQIDDDAHFLVEAIHIVSSDFTTSQDKATAQITDTTSGRTWSNVAVPIRDMAGKGDAAKYLKCPNLLRPSSTITIQINNTDLSSKQFHIVYIGRKIYDLEKEDADFMTRRLWYQYVHSLSAVGASKANVQDKLQIYTDSDFLVHKIMSQQLLQTVFALTGGATDNEVMINFQDSTTSIFLFNAQLSARLVLGQYAGPNTSVSNAWTNGEGLILRRPWLIRRNGQIVSYTTNDSTTAIAAGQLITFEGIRVFDAA